MRTQKEEILQVIRETGRHMSADEIYLACRNAGMNTSMATVYRNLGLMADNQILRRFSIPGKPDCFDITTREHSHMVCTVCKEVVDAGIENLRKDLEAQLHTSIVGYDLCIHYVCPKCRAKADQGKQSEVKT